MAILIITFGTLAAGLVARGEPAGADARAYWAAVRIWLGGGDPYRPTGPFLPYVYAPWMLPVFAPWALLPWDVAWYVWRGGTILAFLWSVHWAYSRRPLTTALTVLVLAFPIGANLDTGNINLPLALLLFAMPFVGPLAAGAIWAMATWMKWVPVVFVLVMKPRARLWGLLFLAVSILLSLATLPETIAQLEALVGFGRRPIRLDYLVFLWALVPILWRRTDPFAWLRPAWAPLAAALLLGVALYQSFLVIPTLERQLAEAAGPQVLPTVVARSATRGDDPAVVIGEKERFVHLVLDINTTASVSSYMCEVRDESGGLRFNIAAPAPQAGSLNLLLPASGLQSGRYTITLRPTEADAQSVTELDKYTFVLKRN